MNNLLEHSTNERLDLVPAVSEVNILVFGMLAVLYGRSCPSSPVRSWGADEQQRSITVHGYNYSAGEYRQNKQPGVRLTVRTEDSRKIVFDGWTSFDCFHKLTGTGDIPWEKVA